MDTSSTDSPPQGPLAKMEKSAFDYTMLKYPETLGEDTRHPYYMTFYINAANDSKYARSGSTSTLASKMQVGADGKTELSEVQKHQQSDSYAKEIYGGVGFQRKTHRTTTSIRLFVPDTMTMDFQHSYDEPSLSGFPIAAIASGIGAVGGIGHSAATGFAQGGAAGSLASLTKGQFVGGAGLAAEAYFGSDTTGLALSALGIAVNPQVDVIYKSPSLRSFRFDFLFAPRNEKESASVQKIIRLFKFHAAPEILDAKGVLGRYFLQPSEFDIEYSMSSSVGKISTCVLEGISVDYAPQGAAFYADGKPVYTRLLLTFKELEYITKERIDEGY